ncbi:alpha/beta hydrolase [bacterium SCSIO 12741]|nr:alpha/beta hydrolase [bacterium SCSIO 12741]
MNNSKIIRFGNWKIEYCTFGEGPEVLLSFHGFGKHFRDFEAMVPTLGQRFRFVSVHLLFHGESIPDEVPNRPIAFERSDLMELLHVLKKDEGFDRFSLLGYSLGGKLVLTLAEMVPEQIDHVFLIAPDGVGINPWYYFSSRTALGQRLHHWSIQNHTVIDGLYQIVMGFKIVPKNLTQFAYDMLKDHDHSTLIYNTWLTYRRLIPDQDKLVNDLAKHEVNIQFFVGIRDQLIPLKPLQRLCARLHGEHPITEFEGGHQISFVKVAKLIDERMEPVGFEKGSFAIPKTSSSDSK